MYFVYISRYKKFGRYSSFVLESHGKPQSYFCTNRGYAIKCDSLLCTICIATLNNLLTLHVPLSPLEKGVILEESND